MPEKKWIVELEDSERDELLAMINKGKAAAENPIIGIAQGSRPFAAFARSEPPEASLPHFRR